MERITLKQTEARGRNGWFKAREAQIAVCEKDVSLDVVSSRPSFLGPVRLELSPEDAVALGRGLLQSVAPPSGFSNPEAAVSALNTLLQALNSSAWLETRDADAIRAEAETLKKLVSLSGSSEADTHGQ